MFTNTGRLAFAAGIALLTTACGGQPDVEDGPGAYEPATALGTLTLINERRSTKIFIEYEEGDMPEYVSDTMIEMGWREQRDGDNKLIPERHCRGDLDEQTIVMAVCREIDGTLIKFVPAPGSPVSRQVTVYFDLVQNWRPVSSRLRHVDELETKDSEAE